MKSDGGQLGPDEIGGQASQQPVLLKEGQLRTHRRQGHDRRSAWRVRFSHAGVKPKPVPLISHYRHLAPTYGRRLCDVAEPAPQSALLGPSVDSFGQARRYRDGDSAGWHLTKIRARPMAAIASARSRRHPAETNSDWRSNSARPGRRRKMPPLAVIRSPPPTGGARVVSTAGLASAAVRLGSATWSSRQAAPRCGDAE